MTPTTPSPTRTTPDPARTGAPRPGPAPATPAAAAALAPPTGWLADAVATVHLTPSALAAPFALAARRTSRAPLRPDTDPGGVAHGTVADAARAALVVAVHDADLPASDLAAALITRYREGDTGERRGVLRGLDALTVRGPLPPELIAVGRDLAADALRTNDPSLVAAATGPFGAAHLDQHTWRHAVVKLVFQQVSLDAVSALDQRADAELARMAGDLAAERRAAGRTVPDDLARIAGPRKES
ncbi:EboA domain-containing protein [Cellulomonas sp. NPDC089187]|uniref:EboA domain-containing protein n=1 Tax=Cellulomonas sp. NPDC089187 TaxID=3154970 RepID=UPI00343EACA0